MTARCVLPVKPQGVWARGIEAWAWSRDRRNWMDTLKLHWNNTEKPLDGVHWNYTGITLKCHWMNTLKFHCTSSALQLHLQCTSNSAPPNTPTSFTYLHLHLQRTPTAPPSTTAFTNTCLAIKSEVHLSAPQKCTPPRVRCAPPSTSAHRGRSKSPYGITRPQWVKFDKILRHM